MASPHSPDNPAPLRCTNLSSDCAVDLLLCRLAEREGAMLLLRAMRLACWLSSNLAVISRYMEASWEDTRGKGRGGRGGRMDG